VTCNNNSQYKLDGDNFSTVITVPTGKFTVSEVYKEISAIYPKDKLAGVRDLIQELFTSSSHSFDIYCRTNTLKFQTFLPYVKTYAGITSFRRSSGIWLTKTL
jgi:hypothetical protein